jgi:hypothetical protein
LLRRANRIRQSEESLGERRVLDREVSIRESVQYQVERTDFLSRSFCSLWLILSLSKAILSPFYRFLALQRVLAFPDNNSPKTAFYGAPESVSDHYY